MPRPATDQLAEHQQRYRELASQLADIGLIAAGSVVQRYTRCSNTGCRCRGDPPQRHGPYYQWTTKVNGKTITRRLSEREATLYQQWIANDRHLRDLINQMRAVAAEASQLIIEQELAPDNEG